MSGTAAGAVVDVLMALDTSEPSLPRLVTGMKAIAEMAGARLAAG